VLSYSEWPASWTFSFQNPICISLLPHMCDMICILLLPWFDHPSVWWGVQIMKLLIAL
jgi:hypothetical protein